MTSCSAPRRILQADSVDVLGPTHHGIFKSIYFFDPNGHRVRQRATSAPTNNMPNSRASRTR